LYLALEPQDVLVRHLSAIPQIYNALPVFRSLFMTLTLHVTIWFTQDSLFQLAMC